MAEAGRDVEIMMPNEETTIRAMIATAMVMLVILNLLGLLCLLVPVSWTSDILLVLLGYALSTFKEMKRFARSYSATGWI